MFLLVGAYFTCWSGLWIACVVVLLAVVADVQRLAFDLVGFSVRWRWVDYMTYRAFVTIVM